MKKLVKLLVVFAIGLIVGVLMATSIDMIGYEKTKYIALGLGSLAAYIVL